MDAASRPARRGPTPPPASRDRFRRPDHPRRPRPGTARGSLGGETLAPCYTARVRWVFSVPADNDRGPQYLDQALAAVHSALGRRDRLCLMVESKGGEVSLGVECTPRLIPTISRQLYAAYPDAKLHPAPVHTPGVVRRFLRSSSDLFPLKRYAQFEDALNRQVADPITALLVAVAAPPAVFVRVELALTRCDHRRERQAEDTLRAITAENMQPYPRFARWFAARAARPQWWRRVLAWLTKWMLAGRTPYPGHVEGVGGRTHDRESPLEAAADKLHRPLFDATLTLSVAGTSRANAEAKLTELAAAFGQFHRPKFAAFVECRRAEPFRLSAEEVATLWHAPTLVAQAPGVSRVDSRERDAPVDLPAPGGEVVTLGEAVFRNRVTRCGLRPDDRRRHLALLGKTGMGKSTLMYCLARSDVRAGRGVVLIDPHGDLAEAVLKTVPRERTNDVIWFDPADAAYPPGFNPLRCRTPADKPLVASGVLSAFKKLYPEFFGPRMEHVFRNALLAALDQPRPTLLTVSRLLNDARFRATAVGKVTDDVVRSFWLSEFAGMPPKLQAEAISPVQNKLGQFLSSPLLRNVLAQSDATLDLRDVLDSGKVLLVNLSKGRLGDDAAGLLGSLLVTQLQLAAMSRADVPEALRRDCYAYVDEFQNFATASFGTILSEARKYRLALTLANQYLAQLDEATLHALFGNVGSFVVFNSGAKDAELLAEQLGGDLLPADLMRLPKHHAYARLLVDGMPTRPFSVRTLAPPAVTIDPTREALVRAASRRRYARPRDQVEAAIRRDLSGA